MVRAPWQRPGPNRFPARLSFHGDQRSYVPAGDGDGISNIFDACLKSPPGAVVNDHGCRIEDVCPCDAQWINHGEYFKCVESTASGLLKAGIIKESEKQRLVKQAIASGCGKH